LLLVAVLFDWLLFLWLRFGCWLFVSLCWLLLLADLAVGYLLAVAVVVASLASLLLAVRYC
jgi:hypothetical protein